MALSPTEPLIVATSFEEPPTAWDPITGERLYTLEGHSGGAFSADFSSDGTLIVTAGTDGTVRLWRATDGTEVLTIQGSADGVTDTRFFPDDSRILIGTEGGHVRIYTLDVEELATIARSRITRTLTDTECLKYHFEGCG